MTLLSNALLFLIKTVLNLLTLVFLLRFYFQLLTVPFQNQAAQMVVSLTNFAVKPVRKIIPSLGKLDVSTLLLGYLLLAAVGFGLLREEAIDLIASPRIGLVAPRRGLDFVPLGIVEGRFA